MKSVAPILILALSLGMYSTSAQVAKFFPGGSPVANKTPLLKIYGGIQVVMPNWKAEAERMRPHPEDSFAIGKMIETTQGDLLKTLTDLNKTLDTSKDEDWNNQWEVAFIECRVRDDLNRVNDDFDSYAATLENSSLPKAEQAEFFKQQVCNIQVYGMDIRLLTNDLENRLRDMAVRTERKQ